MVYGVLDSLLSEGQIKRGEAEPPYRLIWAELSQSMQEKTNAMSKPRLDLEMIGVPLGAILTHNDHEDITCVVTKLSPPEVVLDGKNLSLYEATCMVNDTSLLWRQFMVLEVRQRNFT